MQLSCYFVAFVRQWVSKLQEKKTYKIHPVQFSLTDTTATARRRHLLWLTYLQNDEGASPRCHISFICGFSQMLFIDETHIIVYNIVFYILWSLSDHRELTVWLAWPCSFLDLSCPGGLHPLSAVNIFILSQLWKEVCAEIEASFLTHSIKISVKW